jgi:hypothetical protein
MSSVGLSKLQAKASALGLTNIETEVADLGDYDFLKKADGGWDAIVSIFAHTPENIRLRIHEQVKASLSHGGYFVLEGYHPDNVGRGTGGPQSPDLCYRKATLLSELTPELTVLHAGELERECNEGRLHSGLASVVQLIVRK